MNELRCGSKSSLLRNTYRNSWAVVGTLVLVAAAALAVPYAHADSIYAWGENATGQLGDGTTSARSAPVPVIGMSSGVTAIAAGEYHSLAVQNGAVYAWGLNNNSQLGDGTGTERTSPVSVIGLSSGVTAVAAGESHSMALQNGAIYAWGYGGFGIGDGTVASHNTPVAVTGMNSGVTVIAAGNGRSFAVQNGGLFAWGENGVGELGDGTTTPRTSPVAVTGLTSGVTAIAAGINHSLAVQNGGLFAWGNNGTGQLGDGTTTTELTPIAVTALTNGVTAIAAGRNYSLAVRDGSVYAWGVNGNGRLGDGTTVTHMTPELIDPTDLHNIISIAAGEASSYALSSDGSIWAWGDDLFGEIGVGVFQQQYLTPQHVLPPIGYRFTSIDAETEGSHVLAMLAPVPEPATFLLAALGGLALLSCRRRPCLRLSSFTKHWAAESDKAIFPMARRDVTSARLLDPADVLCCCAGHSRRDRLVSWLVFDGDWVFLGRLFSAMFSRVILCLRCRGAIADLQRFRLKARVTLITRFVAQIGPRNIGMLMFTTLLAVTLRAPADDVWNGFSGNWSNSGAWSGGAPGNNTVAFLPQNAASTYSVAFDGNYYFNSIFDYDILGTLKMSGYFSNGVSNSTILDQTLSNHQLLTYGDEYIGYDGKGLAIYNQSAGSNYISTGQTLGSLYVGYGETASGAYNLSGGALSTLDSSTYSSGQDAEYIGYFGAGTFSQTGGANLTDNEFVGGLGISTTGAYSQMAGSNTTSNLSVGGFLAESSYTLDGGTLSVGHELINDSGIFTQTGGTHTPSSLSLSGTFYLQGGTLNAANVHLAEGGTLNNSGGTFTGVVGVERGTLNHSGGTFTGVIDVEGGTFNLSDTGAFSGTFANQINVSDGVFIQTGGSLGPATVVTQTGGTISGTLVNTGSFIYSGGTFSGALTNRGAVTFNADFSAGSIENDATMTIGAGRTIVARTNVLDNEGLITLNGGTIASQGAVMFNAINNGIISGYGAINTLGGGQFSNNVLLLQGGGNLSLNSGLVQNYGTISLAPGYATQIVGTSTLQSAGVVNLNGSSILGGNFTNAAGGSLIGPGTITGAFVNSGGYIDVNGGALNISQAFTNTGIIHLSSSTSTLLGGAILSTGSIEGTGNVGNAVTNYGTIEAIGGTLNLGGTLDTRVGELITAGTGNKILVSQGLATNSGTINLTGGTFDNNSHPLDNTGQISGYGTLRTSGLTNNGSITFTGGTTAINGDVTNQSGKTIRVAYNPAIFTGNVTNNGTFKTTATTVTFAGTYTENGTFVSDPATQNFQNLVIGSTGALVGGAGDVFNIAGDLLNHSKQKTGWDTRNAEIEFTGGGSHTLAWSGADLGPGEAGYDENFAIGSLLLSASNSLILQDGNVDGGAAIYVGTLDLMGGLGQISSIIGNGVTIHYNASLPGNAYLYGATYALAGGGFITAVPEPRGVVLLGLGSVLILMRSRKSAWTVS